MTDETVHFDVCWKVYTTKIRRSGGEKVFQALNIVSQFTLITYMFLSYIIFRETVSILVECWMSCCPDLLSVHAESGRKMFGVVKLRTRNTWRWNFFYCAVVLTLQRRTWWNRRQNCPGIRRAHHGSKTMRYSGAEIQPKRSYFGKSNRACTFFRRGVHPSDSHDATYSISFSLPFGPSPVLTGILCITNGKILELKMLVGEF